jgi:hypothetical protein
MKNILLLSILLFFLSCSNSTENDNSITQENLISKPDNNPSNNYYSDKPKPKNDSEITEGGIGIIHLGDSLASIDKKFSNVENQIITSEGIEWNAKLISLENGEWILAESTTNDGLISRLHTNSKKFKTNSGIKLGNKLSAILKNKEDIGVNIDEGFLSLRLYKEGVSISIDSVSANKFYQKDSYQLIDIDEDAIFVEFGIY